MVLSRYILAFDTERQILLERIVEDLANRVLSMDPAAEQRLSSLQDSTVVVDFQDAPLPTLLFSFNLQGIQVERLDSDANLEGYDLTLSATPSAFIRAGVASASSDLGGYGIRVSGDVEVATRFMALVKQLDIDWEDELAKRFGDIPARTMSRFVHQGRAWSRQARSSLSENVGEFLREESGEVASTEDVEQFLDDVDRVRNGVDSIEARIARVEKIDRTTGSSDSS